MNILACMCGNSFPLIDLLLRVTFLDVSFLRERDKCASFLSILMYKCTPLMNKCIESCRRLLKYLAITAAASTALGSNFLRLDFDRISSEQAHRLSPEKLHFWGSVVYGTWLVHRAYDMGLKYLQSHKTGGLGLSSKKVLIKGLEDLWWQLAD